MPKRTSRLSALLPLLLVAAVVGLGLCYSGALYQTGAQFYTSCWQKAHAKDMEASTPEEAARWSQCDGMAEPALFQAGFRFAGAAEYAFTPALQALQSACPHRGEIPLMGSWYLAVKLIQNSGGPTLSDRFLPASATIVRVFSDRWPKCAATAAAEGFPRMRVSDKGEWVYATPCLPCKPEDAAAEEANKEFDELARETPGTDKAKSK